MSRKSVRLVSVVAAGAWTLSMSSGVPGVVVSAQVDAPRNAVTTGELFVEPPTLINLGFE